MTGLATRFYREGLRVELPPYKAYLVNFTTSGYCDFYKKTLAVDDNCKQQDFFVELDEQRTNQYAKKLSFAISDHLQVTNAVNSQWEATHNEKNLLPFNAEEEYVSTGGKYSDIRGPIDDQTSEERTASGAAEPIRGRSEEEDQEKKERERIHRVGARMFEKLLTLSSPFLVPGKGPIHLPPKNDPLMKDLVCKREEGWKITDGGCHIRLYLAKNPVIKQNGGRITLDKHDSLSFTVKLRSLTGRKFHFSSILQQLIIKN